MMRQILTGSFFFLGGTFNMVHLKIDGILDYIKYYKTYTALNTMSGRK